MILLADGYATRREDDIELAGRLLESFSDDRWFIRDLTEIDEING